MTLLVVACVTEDVNVYFIVIHLMHVATCG